MFEIDEQSAESRITSEVDNLGGGDEFHSERLWKSEQEFWYVSQR